MSAAADLASIPVVDNHCHAVEAEQAGSVAEWRQYFSESPDPRMRTQDVAETVFYRRLIRRMAGFHGVPADEPALLRARSALGITGLVRALFTDAGIEGTVVDSGYPDPARALGRDEFAEASGAEQAVLLRLELLFQDLVAASASYQDLVTAVRDRLAGVRASGYAGFKSIAGYRTGLAIRRWPRAAAEEAFQAARAEAAARSRVRLGYQPLLDTLLHLAFEAAAAQELPVQFHVGYGDTDVDLRKASPLELREVLEEPAYRPMPVVLLHGCWPYVREGAYLASVYGNAYLDVSFAIPFLSIPELTSIARAAVGTAPASKLMYSSDGGRAPELHWIGAHDGRRVLGTVLGELVAAGDLTAAEAERAAELILHRTARRVYGLTTAQQGGPA
jgi:predicted TIM-barrel fold metal-dependent hydrolase